MDIFFGAGVASHPTIIEQINYLLFMRALSQKDDDLRKISITDPDKIVFDGELEKYRWDNLLTLNAEHLFIALEECFRKIPESTTNRTARLVFRNAHIKLFDKPSLRTVVHELDAFAKQMDEEEHDGKRDIFGDTYEYLLSKLSQAGTSGQFRTPRHIIEFIVAVIAPKKGDTILDPAVGTAGFLVKAFEYLRREYTSAEQLKSGGAFDKLSSKEHSFLYEHTFNGFDSDEDMIKFGMMNLYLHGLQNAHMVRQNSLTDTAGSRDKYDIILANPPFAGKIDRDSVAEELQMNTGSTEVLFLRYMMRHITENGRVGVIVPEGVLFNASGAHTKIREMLLECGLWCVVSLPGGVFNPYAGVKTSILFFDKTRVKKAEVLFTKVENDGFSLSTQRKPIEANDLPEILNDINKYKNGDNLQFQNAHIVTYERIKESNDNNLNGDRYKIVKATLHNKYPMVRLGDITNLVRGPFGGSLKKEIFKSKGYKVYEQNDAIYGELEETRYFVDETKFDEMKRFQVHANDLIMSCSGTLGKIALIYKNAPKGIINQALLKISPSKDVLPKFLKYMLESSLIQDLLKVNSQGGVITNVVSVKQLAQLEFPLPPVEVQDRIVTEIENKQQAIDHAREIIKSLERERQYFDPSTRAQKENWPNVKLGDVFSLVNAKWLPGQKFTNYIGLEDVSSNTGQLNSTQTNEPKSTKTKFEVGDILYGRLRPNLNKVWLATLKDSICSTDFVVLRPKERSKVLPEYFVTLLQSSKLNKQIMSGISGANLPRVSSGYLFDLDINLPPVKVQEETITEFQEEQKVIDSNKKLIQIYEQRIQAVLNSI